CQGNLLEGLQTFHRQHHTHQARWIYEQGRMGASFEWVQQQLRLA
ncbi:hypothetical protein HNR77_002213, partial [Paenibacillus sp. JGP012]|nr:hypothetical protein [Paenibacillus sp. JGP012]